MWGSRAPPDIWPRASVSLLAFDLLVAWSLRLWGDPCLGVQWLSFRVRVLCPLLRRVDVARRDLPCSSVGGLHRPGQRETNRMGERFYPGVAVSLPGLLGAPHRLSVRAVLVCPRF